VRGSDGLESDESSEAQCPQNEQRRSQRCIHWFLLSQWCRSVELCRSWKRCASFESKNNANSASDETLRLGPSSRHPPEKTQVVSSGARRCCALRMRDWFS
jgi:hypothetical protein